MYIAIFDENGYLFFAVLKTDNVSKEDYELIYPKYTVLEIESGIDILEYKVIDGELVKIPDNELQEMRAYGHVLSDKERQSIEEEQQLAKLRPAREEVARAENQLMMLDMLEELKDE